MDEWSLSEAGSACLPVCLPVHVRARRTGKHGVASAVHTCGSTHLSTDGGHVSWQHHTVITTASTRTFKSRGVTRHAAHKHLHLPQLIQKSKEINNLGSCLQLLLLNKIIKHSFVVCLKSDISRTLIDAPAEEKKPQSSPKFPNFFSPLAHIFCAISTKEAFLVTRCTPIIYVSSPLGTDR